MKIHLLLITLLFYSFGFAQTTLLPHGSFDNSLDINFWTLASNTATKSWFGGGCQALYVDNLSNNTSSLSAIITSSPFAVSQSCDYIMEIEYGVVYSGTAAIFELVDSNSSVISSTSVTTTSGTCSSWPNSKFSSIIFSNLNTGNYQLKITIPKCQFFMDGVSLGIYNPITISGSVNDTGCSNSNMLNNFPIKITNLGNNSTAFTTTVNGNYSFVLNNVSGNFLIEAVSNGNIISSPAGINLTINSSSNSYLNNDFCLTSNINGIDVETQLISTSLARPGFVANYDLMFKNNGDTTTGNESLVLIYDNSKVTYVTNSASVPPQSTTSNSITWNYSNLTPLEIRNIALSFNILAPPTVNAGDILSFTGNITAIGDVNSSNNNLYLNQTVVNAYDPNDVLCLEGDEITPTQINDYLTYRVRFQNTGSATAVNVSVKLDLDSDLDLATFQPISASHSYTSTLMGNELTFNFDNINLDDSTTNEPESHGWVFYKIKPKAISVIGDVFDVAASIYFDFNTAVVTNIFTTIIATSSLETYTPDENFEYYLETHDAYGNTVPLGDNISMGNGIVNDNYVTTSKINTVAFLDIDYLNIADLTGIEGFTNLLALNCNHNSIITLDLTQNTALQSLLCTGNQLTGIDVSQNTVLHTIACDNNQLTNLDMRNGNNANLYNFTAIGNPNLTCIFVDDKAYMNANWANAIDATATYIETQTECNTLAVSNTFLEQQIEIYPIPAKENLTVKSEINAKYQIYDYTGKSILKGSICIGENTIPLHQCSKGIYFIEIISNEKSLIKKIVVK